ncbi:hypothetical protein [Streptomyces sp. NPDC059134]
MVGLGPPLVLAGTADHGGLVVREFGEDREDREAVTEKNARLKG